MNLSHDLARQQKLCPSPVFLADSFDLAHDGPNVNTMVTLQVTFGYLLGLAMSRYGVIGRFFFSKVTCDRHRF
jgi:hypothetical protein